MSFYIQVWPNKTATLMLENGTAVWTYPNVESATAAYSEWHQSQRKEDPMIDMLPDAICTAML